MINKGIVKSKNGDEIEIKLYKESACGHCNKCGPSEKFGTTIKMNSKRDIEIGDEITLEVEDKVLLKLTGLIYLIPPLGMIGFYYLGEKIVGTQGGAIISSFLGLILTFVCIATFDKKRGKKIIDRDMKIVAVEKK